MNSNSFEFVIVKMLILNFANIFKLKRRNRKLRYWIEIPRRIISKT